MTKLNKHIVLSILLSMPSEEIAKSFRNPTPYMDKYNLACHRIAYKKLTGKKLSIKEKELK